MDIGLFPLGIVLLPTERIPLHIFEERYKELIGECLEREAPFGLIYRDASGSRTVGTTAMVVSVLQRLPDGRMTIVVEGGDRFRVVELTSGRAFATAQIERLDDEGAGTPPPEEAAACLDAYERAIRSAGGDPETFEPAPGPLSYWIAARIELGAEVKQDLLETRSESERLSRLTRVLNDAAELFALRKVARQRAGGNGQVVSS